MTTDQPQQPTASVPPAQRAPEKDVLRPATPGEGVGAPARHGDLSPPAASGPTKPATSSPAKSATSGPAGAATSDPAKPAASDPAKSAASGPAGTATSGPAMPANSYPAKPANSGAATSASGIKPPMSEAARAALIDKASAPTPPQPGVAEERPARPGRRRFLFFGKRPAPASAPAPQIPAQATKPSVGALAAAAGVNGTAVAPSDVAAAPEAAPGVKLKEPLPSDRPAHAPPDPWTAFATAPERPPGRIRRGLRAVARGLIHEYALVTYIALAIAVALTWPTLQYPLHTLPQDLGDPARQAWQIAWSGHILLTDPVKLWQSNAFFNEPNSFAFGDSLLGYAPAGMIGDGPLAATLRYNILFVLAHALLLIGSYALVRQLGAGRTGAAVAAVAFAYAPWRLAQQGHLDIISAGGIPLALAMLARGHGWSMRRGFRRKHRNAGWAAAGWLVAAWQVSLGFSLGLPFLGVLGLILLVLLVRVPIRWWRRPTERPVLGWRLLVTDVLGPLIVAGIAAVIALPYFKNSGTATATAEIKFFSPPLRSLLIGPAESRLWGGAHAVPRSSLAWPAEMSLLPGFVLYALALAGLAFSIWTLWQRLFLLAGLATTIILVLGTNFFDGRWTYLPLFGHLPAALATRVPGRLMLWVTLLLAILAAGAVAEFVRRADHWAELRIPPWPGPWLRTATLIPLALVLVEGWNSTAHPVVPDQPAAMRTVTGPMLVLPTAELTDQMTMLWSTTRFQQIANGSGGFAAGRQADLRRQATTFPDQASVDYLRTQGITTVLLLRAYVTGTPWERAGDIPVDALGITREDLDDAVLFRLTQPTPTEPANPTQPGQGTPSQPGTFPEQPGQPVPGRPDQTFPTQPTQAVQPTLQAQPLGR